MTSSVYSKSNRGFTLIELLVVTAMIGILAALLMAVLSKAKGHARRVQCSNNQKQLLLTWNLYSSDNEDRLAPNGHGIPDSPIAPAALDTLSLARKFWIAGDSHFYYPAFTNSQLLTNPEFALFGSYVHAAAVYKCPADKSSLKRLEGVSHPHVRSYSLNAYLGWAVDPDS